MNTRMYWTFGGDLFLGDADDENAPLVQVRFCNEARRLSVQEKVKMLAAMVEAAPSLADALAETKEP